MSSENPFGQPGGRRIALSDPQGRLAEAEPDTTETGQADQLACGLCYRPFAPTELTVASKERFNWEASVVVCPECLTELKLEMRARSKGPDLLLGVVWAVMGFVVTTLLFGLAIWSTRSDSVNALFWQWLGCYFAFVPGFIIGRLVRYGVGRRHSLEQQLIAIFFTLAVVVTTVYIGWLADNNNVVNVVTRQDNRIILLSLPLFLTSHFIPSVTELGNLQNFWPRIGIDLGIIVGVVVAYFSSEGTHIYTKPFARKA